MAFQQPEQSRSLRSERQQTTAFHLWSNKRKEEEHHERRPWPENEAEKRLARSLGWFSIGLGLAGIAAPRRLARLIGVKGDRETCTMLRTVGLREFITGVGILSQPQPTAGWLLARVGGDVMDLAFLSSALTSEGVKSGRVAAATAAVLGVAALDLRCSKRLGQKAEKTRVGVLPGGDVHTSKTITINCAPGDVYRFWRDFRNLPRFMPHLDSVQVTGEKRSHWIAKGPVGARFAWDSEIIDDRPGELIAWRSLEGSDVDNSGSVRFERAPGGRGAVVKVEIEYRLPGGRMGSAIAQLFGVEPGRQLQEDLRRLKQLMEIGEIVQSDASMHRGPQPAQPSRGAYGAASRG